VNSFSSNSSGGDAMRAEKRSEHIRECGSNNSYGCAYTSSNELSKNFSDRMSDSCAASTRNRVNLYSDCTQSESHVVLPS
jgi:hypothetical protein